MADLNPQFKNPAAIFYQHLTTNGAPSGSNDQAINHPGGGTLFSIKPALEEYYICKRMSLNIVNATGGINWDGYMNIAAGGAIQGRVSRDSGIKTNLFGKVDNVLILSDWARLLNLRVLAENAAAPSCVVGDVNFDPPITLSGSFSERLELNFITFDFSTFEKHETLISGERFRYDGATLEDPADG